MKVHNVKEVFDFYSQYRGQYIYIEGYYADHCLFDANPQSTEVLSVGPQLHKDIDMLLHKIGLDSYEGKIRVVGKVNAAMTPHKNIGDILRVELLNDNGSVTATEKIHSNSIPKSMREEI